MNKVVYRKRLVPDFNTLAYCKGNKTHFRNKITFHLSVLITIVAFKSLVALSHKKETIFTEPLNKQRKEKFISP